MIRCDVIELEGRDNVEVRCSNDASWNAAGRFFCEACLAEALREGTLRGTGLVALFIEESAVVDASAVAAE